MWGFRLSFEVVACLFDVFSLLFQVLPLTIWGSSMFEANGSTVAPIEDGIFLIVLGFGC